MDVSQQFHLYGNQWKCYIFASIFSNAKSRACHCFAFIAFLDYVVLINFDPCLKWECIRYAISARLQSPLSLTHYDFSISQEPSVFLLPSYSYPFLSLFLANLFFHSSPPFPKFPSPTPNVFVYISLLMLPLGIIIYSNIQLLTRIYAN